MIRCSFFVFLIFYYCNSLKSKDDVTSSDIPDSLFQNVDDENFIFDESKTVSNTSTSKPDPEIREQPEMIFDDFPDNSIPEVVSIDDNYSDGNTGCRVFKGGIENSIDFLPKINIVRGNICTL